MHFSADNGAWNPSRTEVAVLKCGLDVKISPLAVLDYPENISIGNHVAIDAFVVTSVALEFGDYVHIAPLCSIVGGPDSKFVARDFSGLSAGCRVVCAVHPFYLDSLADATILDASSRPRGTCVTLEKHAILGTSVVVHPGVTIGEGTVVGSCSLVTQDLEPWGIYVGNPARRVSDRRRDRVLELADRLAMNSR
jgi:acetyltransferase-like isoleucine patch superfamily enzyme